MTSIFAFFSAAAAVLGLYVAAEPQDAAQQRPARNFAPGRVPARRREAAEFFRAPEGEVFFREAASENSGVAAARGAGAAHFAKTLFDWEEIRRMEAGGATQRRQSLKRDWS